MEDLQNNLIKRNCKILVGFYWLQQRRKTTGGTLGLSLEGNVLCQRLEKKNNDLPPPTGKKSNSLREGKYRKHMSAYSELLHLSTVTEYNPLMGDSVRRYRPPKRSCCGGKRMCG